MWHGVTVREEQHFYHCQSIHFWRQFLCRFFYTFQFLKSLFIPLPVMLALYHL